MLRSPPNIQASQSPTLAPTMRPSSQISMTTAAARPTRECGHLAIDAGEPPGPVRGHSPVLVGRGGPADGLCRGGSSRDAAGAVGNDEEGATGHPDLGDPAIAESRAGLPPSSSSGAASAALLPGRPEAGSVRRCPEHAPTVEGAEHLELHKRQI